jgi:hypothetical protein
MKHGSRPLDFRQDVRHLRGPRERPGVVVVLRDEGLDGGDEIGDTLERPAARPLGRELAEPPRDQVSATSCWSG